MVFPPTNRDDGIYDVLMRYYVPESALRDRSDYQIWIIVEVLACLELARSARDRNREELGPAAVFLGEAIPEPDQ